jgi:hypothetical protein
MRVNYLERDCQRLERVLEAAYPQVDRDRYRWRKANNKHYILYKQSKDALLV